MPHVALLGLSIFMSLLFEAISALFALIETGAGEPLSRNYLSLSCALPLGGRAGALAGWAHGLAQLQLGGPASGGAVAAALLPCSGFPRPPPGGSHFILRRLIKFALPLVPVALKTVPHWEARGGRQGAAWCWVLALAAADRQATLPIPPLPAGLGAVPAGHLVPVDHHPPRALPPHHPQRHRGKGAWVGAAAALPCRVACCASRRRPSRPACHAALPALPSLQAFLYSWCWYASGLALIGTYYPQARGNGAARGRPGGNGKRGRPGGGGSGSAEAAVHPTNSSRLDLPPAPSPPPPTLQHWPKLTTAFLAGMAPVGAAFGALSWWRLRRKWRVALSFERWTPQLPRREVYRFRDEAEVEVVARCGGQGRRGCSAVAGCWRRRRPPPDLSSRSSLTLHPAPLPPAPLPALPGCATSCTGRPRWTGCPSRCG